MGESPLAGVVGSVVAMTPPSAVATRVMVVPSVVPEPVPELVPEPVVVEPLQAETLAARRPPRAATRRAWLAPGKEASDMAVTLPRNSPASNRQREQRPTGSSARDSRWRDLYDALGRLPADLRLPWSLHRIERLSIPETAAACEVSPATVKRRIADAEERLTRRLGPESTKEES